MKQNHTKMLVLHAFFIAIELLLISIPFLGYIPLGPLNATTLHIPVLIAGIVLGKRSGALIGLLFGVSSIMNGILRPTFTSFVFCPFISGNIMSGVIAIVPRMLIGYVAGWLYERVGTKYPTSGMIGSALMGSLSNTILVLLGIYVVFGSQYGSAIGKDSSQLLPYFIGVLGTQGLVETIVGTVIAVAISRPLVAYIEVRK